MEKSLDQLIEHLLGEIAVCGPAGVTVADLTAFVDDFYYGTRNNNDNVCSIAQVVDDAFIASVWRWLGKHPDVSLGANKEHNTTALRSLARSGVPLTEQSSNLPRISVSGDRIYQAICGHAPDSRRVFKSEYGLLLSIAAARSDGILQGELGRIAGQDKRSVPKRTDSLHAKGYIVKETAVARGHKSSRLTLRRFASKAQIAQAEKELAEITSHIRQERTVQDVVNDVVSTLATVDLIDTDDLARRVRMSTQLAQKALLKILRVLTKAGYVKKVKAAIGASAHTGEPKICFRRIRDFADTDLNGFADTPLDPTRPVSEVLEEIDADIPDTDVKPAEEDEMVMQWNPDRNTVNTLQHAAVLAGAKGISNASARQILTGMNVKRPVESQLHRISFASLVAQPDHLRHLAVVRSNKGVAGQQYVHHSFSAFLEGAEKGKLDTATVPGAASVLRARRQATHASSDGQSTEVDAFGFPVVKPSLLLRDGTATLADCVRSIVIEDVAENLYDASDSDIRPYKRFKTAANSTPFASHSASSPRVSSTQKSAGSQPATRDRGKSTYQNSSLGQDSAVRGRPRKFLAGTEKFWQHHFFRAKLEAEGPDARKAGCMNHPAGKTIFQNRPELFDETLVQAREGGLPLPNRADDISTEWIQQTQAVLQRSGPGAYVTPAGMYVSRVLHTSQKLIIRSDKLHTVDFRERPKVYAYRFLTSMAAHSFQNWRWYPTKPPRKKRARHLPPPKPDVEYPEDLLGAFGKLPQMGVFYDNSVTPQAPLLQPQLTTVPKVTPEEYRELMAETDIDSEVERREQKEKLKLTPATPRTSRAEVPDSPSQASPRSFHDQIDGFEDTPLRTGYGDGHNDEQDDDHAFGGSENAIIPQPSSLQESPRSVFQPLKKARSYSLGQPLLPVQGKSVSSLGDPFVGNSGSPRSLKGSMRMPVGAPALVTMSTSASNEDLEEPPNHREDDLHQKERAKVISSSGSRGAGAKCRKALLSLLTARGGLAPQNVELLRQGCADNWRLQGQSGLPSAAIVKLSLRGLVDSGLLKQHTFSFRSTEGVMLSRSILFFPEMQITDANVQHLKQETIKADTEDYVPPQWEDLALSMNQAALPSSDTGTDGSEAVENEEAVLLDTNTPSSRPKRDRKPTARAASQTPSISRARRGRRPVSLSPSAATGFLSLRTSRSPSVTSRPISLPSSPATGFLSLRTSRSPSVTSRSSASSSNQGDINLGFLTLKVPRLGTLPQVQQFNANLQTPKYLKTAPIIAPIAGPTAPKKQRRPRVVKPKKDTSLQKLIWKTPRLPESLDELLMEQYKHDHGTRSPLVQDEPQDVDSQLATVLQWEERLAEKLVETKAPWTFINFLATSPTIALEGIGVWYRVEYSADDASTELPIDDVESWLPFRQALEKLRLEPGLGSHTPNASTGRRITRHDTGSIRKRQHFDFGDAEVEDSTRRKRARKQADIDFEDEEDSIKPARVERPYRKKANPVASQHASILSKTSNEDIFRIAVSVVLVSTLVGGAEKTINWSIVTKLNPTLLRSTITSRWKAITFTYPDEVNSMTSNLRSLYLDAVQASEVPLVNLTNHAESAWQDILNWALAIQPNFLKENVLPASRAALLANFSLEYSTQQNIRPFFAPAAALRTSEREEYIVSVPFSTPIHHVSPVEGLSELARSSILSTLLTTNSPSRIAKLASQQLGSLSSERNNAEQATATALHELLADRVIVKVDTSLKRMPPLIEDGKRAYSPTEKMSEMLDLKRIINRGVLLEAMEYKLDVLDAAFEAGEVVQIPNQSQIINGQMVAVFNLVSSGMVRIRPGNGGQKSRFGVAWERVGYQSKQIDARDLGFEVALERTDAYRFGDVAESVRGDAPTRGSGGRGQHQHPMWIDLQGDVMTQIWEKVLAAVVGLTSMRPGVQVMEIREMLGGVLTRWEVETVLLWAESRRFVRRTVGGGWETEEWWWMCLGKDTDWGGSWAGDE